jgi:hypothetical protein
MAKFVTIRNFPGELMADDDHDQDLTQHPFIELLVTYYQDFKRWKEAHSDLSPAAFNREYGLLVQGPIRWPYIEGVQAVCNRTLPNSACVVVIYGSTAQYDKLSKRLNSHENLSYISWQEIYSAMQLVRNDVRLLQGIRDRLSSADVVFFLGAPLAVQEVIDQVKALCDGCLMIFA